MRLFLLRRSMAVTTRGRKTGPETSNGGEQREEEAVSESTPQPTKELGVQVERVLIELACVVLLLLLTVGCLFVFNVSPLVKSSRQSPGSVFVMLVMAVYFAFRAYFGGAFALLGWIQVTPLVAASPHKALVSQGVIATATFSGLALLYLAFPEARASLVAGLWSSLGDLPEVLDRSFQGEKKRLYERAWKVMGLLVGWTLFFFAFELVARLGLYLTLGLVRAVARGLKAGGSAKKDASTAASEGAVEEEGGGQVVAGELEEDEVR